MRIILNISTEPLKGTLTETSTPGQSEPGSNGNEGVLHIPHSSRTEDSPLDAVGWLFGFYGVSTFVGYLTPNSVYMYIHSN